MLIYCLLRLNVTFSKKMLVYGTVGLLVPMLIMYTTNLTEQHQVRQ
jgi:hypothetical protein